MSDQSLYVASHAPCWHNGSSIAARSRDVLLAALPAVLMGIYHYGVPALRVIAFSVSCAMLWELLLNKVMKRPVTIGDGNAAVIGLLLAMLFPATVPWWFVVLGTFVAVVVGKQIYGGIGCNPMNPPLVAFAALILSWKGLLDFDEALVNYDLGFHMAYPLNAVKFFGPSAVENYSLWGLLMGQQAAGVGAGFGLGLILGGIYLILRGHIRWEIPVSFLIGVFVTALLFNVSGPERYAPACFHLLSGYTLIGAFFLSTEDSSSPVHFISMLIFGLGAGCLTVLIRNVGFFVDGVVFAILMMNLANPLIDKIRPKALGRNAGHA